ncbi:MAG: TIGR00270 family protein [Nanohaloarchaea archaeon]|nr:TIGR00270 family protein [Candidatus Nanohaloarchaea archaeon]
MSSCELCGQEADSLKKVKIEGTILKTCESCASMGDEVGSSSSSKKRKKKKRKKKSSSKDVLVNGYGEKIKKARESKQLSIAEVAEDINEKESLLKKLEQEQLKPDKPLAKKISKKFDIKLYTNPEVADYSRNDDADSRKATMEDVADIN